MSGCADVRWGIEINSMAASAFKKNHPNSRVYIADANELLQKLIHSDESKCLLFDLKNNFDGRVITLYKLPVYQHEVKSSLFAPDPRAWASVD